jgi:hypothetical protein
MIADLWAKIYTQDLQNTEQIYEEVNCDIQMFSLFFEVGKNP